MQPIKRVPGYSLLRVIACIAVVILHLFASANILFKDQITDAQRLGGNIIVNCMMWAVPCFVMVTGALLLDRRREITYQKIFKKYIPRILGALIVFGELFAIFDMVMDTKGFHIDKVLEGFYKIFTGTGWSHLWYLYLLIGLYLLLPFYRKIAKLSSEKDLKYLLGIYVFFISILPLTQLFGVKSGFYIHVSTIYPCYLFLGYALAKGRIKLSKVVASVITAVGAAGIIIATICKVKFQTEQIEMLYGYSSIFVILMAAGVFYLIYKVKINTRSMLWKCVECIDECSFGIYILHMVLVRLILRYWNVNPYAGNAVLKFAGLLIVIFAISFAVTWCLRKIPGVKKIL